MGKNLKRLKRPRREKVQNPVPSPTLGQLWIKDIALHAIYYPKDNAAFKRTVSRLKHEKKVFTTSKDTKCQTKTNP